jgi:hypothetical protein
MSNAKRDLLTIVQDEHSNAYKALEALNVALLYWAGHKGADDLLAAREHVLKTLDTSRALIDSLNAEIADAARD